MKKSFSLTGLILSIFSLALLVTLTACNSNSSSGDAILEGTVAVGAAFVGDVEVINAQGDKTSTTIAQDGSYSVTISNKAPFMLKAVAADGTELYSFSSDGGTVNITELTNLAMHLASSGGALSDIFSDWVNLKLADASVQAAIDTVRTNLLQQFTANSLSGTYNFFTEPFAVGTAGIDQLMDAIAIAIDRSQALASSVQIVDANNNPVVSGGFDVTAVSTDTGTGGSGGSTGGTGGTLPDTVKGQIVIMTFGSATSGAPYANGDQVKFTFSSSGTLMLTEQFVVVSDTFTVRGSEYVWVDSANSLEYALSLNNGAINEVNVTGIDGSPFLGQFNLASTGSGDGGSTGGDSGSGGSGDSNADVAISGSTTLTGVTPTETPVVNETSVPIIGVISTSYNFIDSNSDTTIDVIINTAGVDVVTVSHTSGGVLTQWIFTGTTGNALAVSGNSIVFTNLIIQSNPAGTAAAITLDGALTF